MLLFVLPWLVMAVPSRSTRAMSWAQRGATALILLATSAIFFLTRDYETNFVQREVLRDSTATVIAARVPDESGPGRRRACSSTASA